MIPGAAMAVSENGEVAGSVSGGCVEGAVVGEALQVLETGLPRLVTFGYSDDEAFAVGPDVRRHHPPLHRTARLVGAVPSIYEVLRESLLGEAAGRARHGDRWRASRRDAARCVPSEPSARHARRSRPRSCGARDALAELESGRTGVRHYGEQGQANETAVSVFVESFAPPPQMLIFGAVDFTAALGRVAKILGYRVTVCDAREVFATPRRFPMADEVVVDWPNRVFDRVGASLGPRDAVCILTHDPKFDVPAVLGALKSRAGYIGVMGSRKTHDKRLERLLDEGVDMDEFEARVMSPIGLDIGARSPEETAVSICAEIIARRTGRTPPSLRDRSGPIH